MKLSENACRKYLLVGVDCVPRYNAVVYICVIIMFQFTLCPGASSNMSETMIRIEGGTFTMGDVFGEGNDDELPLHDVTLDGFNLGRTEVTVGEFREFVEDTGYLTSAEQIEDYEGMVAALDRIGELRQEENPDMEEFRRLAGMLISGGGCSVWIPHKGGWDYSMDCNWRTPLFDQTENDPVVCMSWNDAASYCNWLSENSGLPKAYDIDTGELLDSDGLPTNDIQQVVGYRLPTEAEWEYAAREMGREVRFANGQNNANADQINFNATGEDYSYTVDGDYRMKTSEVGTLAPNGLGLHEMSGNAWEWCSDFYIEYTNEAQVNPHGSSGTGRVIRGGRWGGDANEARVSARTSYRSADRCNNAGFRIAISL